MDMRPLAATLVVAVAVSLVAAGDASAKTVRQFDLQPAEFRETDAGDVLNWGRDTVITEDAPGANYENERFLNTSPVPGERSEILLRFPLDQPMRKNRSGEVTPALPANVSVSTSDPDTEANLRLYYRDAMDSEERGRSLAIHSIRNTWKEGEVDWDTVRDTTGFRSRTPIVTSPPQDALQDDYRVFDVTPYMAEVLDPANPSPFLGFLVRDDADADNPTCLQSTVSCLQEFYSSNWLNDDSENTPADCDAVDTPETCLPHLVVDARMNKPQGHNLSYEHGQDGEFFAPEEKLNFTADIWDPAGEVEEVYLDLHHENGTRMFREDISGNRSRNLSGDRPDVPSSFKFYWNRSLEVPPGNYTFNLTMVDSDDRTKMTSFEDPNVTVEDTDPTIHSTEVGPSVLEPNQEISFVLDTTDARGIEEAWAVLDHTDRPPVRTDEFDPDDDVRGDGNGTYRGSHSFAFPGTYNVTLEVRDKPGNVASLRPCEVDASAPCSVKVNDTEKPTILESCIVVGNSCKTSRQGQEIGGSLRFLLRAADNHPRAPEVSLVLTHLDTGTRERFDDLEPDDPQIWRHTVGFDADEDWPTGLYRASWVIEDPDGNVRRSGTPLSFLLEPARPPKLVDASPQPWGPAEPHVVATLKDVNIDPDRVRMEVSVNDGRFESVPTTVTRTLGKADASGRPGPFVHGDQVRVRVTATDTLDRTGNASWAFQVDDRDPRADVDLDGRALEGLARQVIPASTHLSFSGSDNNESGLDRVEYRLSSPGRAASDWRGAGGPVNLTRDPSYQGPGPYEVSYRAVDAAGNRGSRSSIGLYVDTEDPAIEWSRGPGSVRLTVEDPGAGLEEVQAFYRNASNPFERLTPELVQRTPDGGLYQADLPFTPEGTPVQVYFVAVDRLGHTGTLGEPGRSGDRPIRWVQPNHPPDVEIAAPQRGEDVSGSTPVVWRASDADGDPVSVDVTARPIPLDDARPVADLPGNPGRTTWDTTEFPDGRYELRVSARDGRNVSHDAVLVDIRNTDTGLAGLGLPASGTDPGKEVPISVTIYREVASVEATITSGDEGAGDVETLGLRDDGTGGDADAGDGTYTGLFTPARETSYSVSLTVAYDDGSTEEIAEAGTFTVETTLAEQIDENRDVLAVAAGLVVFLAGATVIQLYRYGYI